VTDVPQPAAWLHHEWCSDETLFGYPPEAADRNRMGNVMHDRLYGMETRSPRTPYVSVWRDAAKHSVEDRKLGWPTIILLGCGFGSEPWEPPLNLIEEATQRQHRDEADLRLKWVWDGDAYRLAELGLELRRAGSARPFRSFHRGDDLARIEAKVSTIPRPSSDQVTLPFHITGQLRERYNYSEEQKGEAVRFSAMGTASPLPPWMMY